MDNMDLVQILDMAYQKLTKEISSAYYNGRIDEVLKKYELEEKTAGHFHYNYSNSKIIVIGESRVIYCKKEWDWSKENWIWIRLWKINKL